MKQRCTYRSDAGKPCNTWAQHGRSYCFFHDPEKAQARREAQSRGGQPKRAMAGEAIPLRSAQDVAAFVAELINGIRTGAVNKANASILSTLSQTLLRAIELGELEERVEQLEDKLEDKR